MDKRRAARTEKPRASGPQPVGRNGDELGSRLRELFDSVEQAPVPDEISRLVVELERKRRAPRRDGST